MLATGGHQPIAYESGSYVPGVCNIGKQEIAKRRRAGIAALAVAAALAILLVALDAPAAARWLLVIPVGLGAVGLLQARRRFCVQFAAMGISDSSDQGTQRVDDPVARAADRRTAIAIGLQSLAIALLVTVVFVVLPI
jgi:hypothetical protein